MLLRCGVGNDVALLNWRELRSGRRELHRLEDQEEDVRAAFGVSRRERRQDCIQNSQHTRCSRLLHQLRAKSFRRTRSCRSWLHQRVSTSLPSTMFLLSISSWRAGNRRKIRTNCGGAARPVSCFCMQSRSASWFSHGMLAYHLELFGIRSPCLVCRFVCFWVEC